MRVRSAGQRGQRKAPRTAFGEDRLVAVDGVVGPHPKRLGLRRPPPSALTRSSHGSADAIISRQRWRGPRTCILMSARM